jgi:hypothetical protein
MTDATEATGRNSLGRTGSPLLAPIRIGIGLVQGLGLFWLHRTSDPSGLEIHAVDRIIQPPPMGWPATEPLMFGPFCWCSPCCRSCC